MRTPSTRRGERALRWSAAFAALVLLAPIAVPPAAAACAAMADAEAMPCAHCGPVEAVTAAESVEAEAPSCHGKTAVAAEGAAKTCPSSTATRSCCEISAAREAGVVPSAGISLPENQREVSLPHAAHAAETGVVPSSTASHLERSRGTPLANEPPAEYLSSFLRL